MRTERIIIPTIEIDQLEKNWWNDNADTIEKIWAQSDSIQQIIRLPYLKRMKNFFLENAKNSPVRILEVGCGSGWVGQLVADERLRIIGTDFSANQLAIAAQKSAERHTQNFCTYELADASTFEKEIDGVLLHAVLHHLSEQELVIFFKEFNKLKSGTKVFIYEPTFFKQTGLPSMKDRLINKFIEKLRTLSISLMKRSGQIDLTLKSQVDELFFNARKNGWYLSPKEVPFHEGELEKYLEGSCTLQNKYIVNRTDLAIAQDLTRYQIHQPDFVFSKVMLPLAAYLDKLAFKGNFSSFIHPDNHLFVCYEMIKK